jgi:hypothetical protein
MTSLYTLLYFLRDIILLNAYYKMLLQQEFRKAIRRAMPQSSYYFFWDTIVSGIIAFIILFLLPLLNASFNQIQRG